MKQQTKYIKYDKQQFINYLQHLFSVQQLKHLYKLVYTTNTNINTSTANQSIADKYFILRYLAMEIANAPILQYKIKKQQNINQIRIPIQLNRIFMKKQ